jgi:hypothetical protein
MDLKSRLERRVSENTPLSIRIGYNNDLRLSPSCTVFVKPGDSRTRRVGAASGRGEWTRRVDAASGRGEWTRRVDAASGRGEWTRRGGWGKNDGFSGSLLVTKDEILRMVG